MKSLLFILLTASGIIGCTAGVALASAPSAAAFGWTLVLVGVLALLWANAIGRQMG